MNKEEINNLSYDDLLNIYNKINEYVDFLEKEKEKIQSE